MFYGKFFSVITGFNTQNKKKYIQNRHKKPIVFLNIGHLKFHSDLDMPSQIVPKYRKGIA